MAESTTPHQQGDDKSPKDDETRNTGTPDPGAFDSADSAVGEASGLSEGEVKALRDDAGLNQLAGNEANTLAWETTPAGKEFLKGEKDRVKKYKEEAKAYDEATNKDGLTEAEAKYREAVDKAHKG